MSKYPWIAINKRMKFGDGKGASPFQSAIIYLGKDLDRFNTVFGKYGTLYVPYTQFEFDSLNMHLKYLPNVFEFFLKSKAISKIFPLITVTSFPCEFLV